ncbi:hypothetical protein ACVBE9_06610 [Eionea flava]
MMSPRKKPNTPHVTITRVISQAVMVSCYALSTNALANSVSNSDTAKLIFQNLTQYQSLHRSAKKLRYAYSYEQCNVYVTKESIIGNTASPVSTTQYSIPLKSITSVTVNSSKTKVVLKTSESKKEIYQISQKKNGNSEENNISWIPLPLKTEPNQTQTLINLLIQRCKIS